MDFSSGVTYASKTQEAAFLTAAAKMLDGLSYLKRYAWFALPAKDEGASSGLFNSGPVMTDIGRAFAAAR